MRFHCGISFSWKTIKKFLFPIILGLLAFFGFSFIYDRHDLPLGFLKVNALEDLNSSYTLLFDDTDYYNTQIDNNYTFKTFVEYLKTLNSSYYNFVISPSIYKNGSDIHLQGFSILIVPIADTSFDIVLYGQNNSSNFFFRTSKTYRYFQITTYNQNISDITNNTDYLKFYNCYISNSNCFENSTSISKSDNNYFGDTSSIISSGSDSNIVIPHLTTYNSIVFDSIYYSSVPVTLSNNYWTTSNYIFKSIVYNDEVINVGDSIPTYLDYVDSQNQPEPDEPIPPEPDEPVEPETNHKPLHDKIYWFDDSSTSLGVMSSIYILLFLYCISMIILRILTIIKNTRW